MYFSIYRREHATPGSTGPEFELEFASTKPNEIWTQPANESTSILAAIAGRSSGNSVGPSEQVVKLRMSNQDRNELLQALQSVPEREKVGSY